jgi:hypothetical protein
MNRAVLSATLAGAFVFVPSICWTQSWAQDQGRPPAPPALVGVGLPVSDFGASAWSGLFLPRHAGSNPIEAQPGGERSHGQ